MSPVEVDAKAGWCATCRGGQHALCASPTCKCPRAHTPSGIPAKRPAGRRRGGPAAVLSITPPRVKRPKPAAPVFELVKADPPEAVPTRRKLAELLRPLLEEILVDGGDDWWRVAVYPSRLGAGQAAGRLSKRYATGWEWRAARLDECDQSALYVRRVDRNATVS